MVTFKQVIGPLASLSSCVLLSSPIVTMRELNANNSIGVMKVTYYCAQMLNCVTWGLYGVLTESAPLLFAEFLGITVTTYCILTFMSIARKEMHSHHQLANTTLKEISLFVIGTTIISVAAVACTIVLEFRSAAVAVAFVGFSGSIASMLMYSSPLELLGKIIREKNAAGLAPVTMASSFVCCGLWTMLGLADMDWFLILCNAVGVLCPIVQFYFLVKFGRKQEAKPEITVAEPAVPKLLL